MHDHLSLLHHLFNHPFPFFFVFHSSWSSNCSSRYNPIMIFVYVQIERRWTWIISSTTTFIHFLCNHHYFLVFLNKISILTLAIKDKFIFFFLEYKMLRNPSLWSKIWFLWCSLRIYAIMLFLYMHIQSRSWLIDKTTTTFMNTVIFIRKLSISISRVMLIVVMEAKCRFWAIIKSTNRTLIIFRNIIFYPSLIFNPPIFPSPLLMLSL